MMQRLLPVSFITVLLASSPTFAQTGIQRIWAVDDGERIKKTELNHPLATSPDNPVWDGTRVSLFGGRNEVVAFQLILQGNATGATAVNVTLDSLYKSASPSFTIKNTGGIGDPYNYVGKRIEMFVEHYMNITSRSAAPSLWWSSARPLPDSDFLGLLPEQLVPFEAEPGQRTHGQGGAPFTVSPQQNQAVWVDVYIPRDAPPGDYIGTMRVAESGTPRLSVPVALRVYDFVLPDTSHLRSTFHIGAAGITGRHGVSKGSPQYWSLMRRYYAMGHRHRADFTDGRVTQATFGAFLAPFYTGDYYVAANGYEGPGNGVGNRVYSIGTYDQPRTPTGTDNGAVSGFTYDADTSVFKATWQAASTAWMTWFQTHAPDVLVYKYMADEPGITDTAIFPDIRRKARWLKTAPGAGRLLRTLSTTNVRPDLRGSIDIWMGTGQSGYVNGGVNPYPAGYIVDSAMAVRSRGGLAGFYNGTAPAFGTHVIDAPATHMRVNPWIAWKYNVDLYLLWYVNHWGDEDNQPIDPWAGDRRNVRWGDGSLVYAGENLNSGIGNDRGLTGPVAGIRLKNWRRGAQDYEYLWLAQHRGINTRSLVDTIVAAAFDETPQNQPARHVRRGFQFERVRRALAELLEAGGAVFPTGTLAVSPDSLPAGGGTAQLTWTSENATEATLQGVGAVPVSGSLDVPVTSSTTFRLTLRNAAGSQTVSTTVHVGATLPDPEGTLIVSPDTLPAGGGSATLIWVSSNATTASLSPGIGAVPVNGSHVVTLDTAAIFSLSLGNGLTSVVRQASIAIAQAPPPPTGTFIAAPDSLPAGGGSAQLVWTSSNTTTASIQPGIGNVPLSGSQAVSIDSTRTYTLTLSGPSGTNILSAPVRVAGLPPAPSGTFAATPDTLPPGGGRVVLSWTSVGAATASISNAVGAVPVNGSLNVSVTASTVYRLTLENPAGTQTLQVFVTVRPTNDSPTGTFVITPDTLPPGGGNATLVWVSNGAVTASLDNGIGAVPVTGSRSEVVDVSRRFALRLENSAGSRTLEATAVVQGSLPPPQVVLVVTPDSLPSGGGEVKFIWYSENSDSLVLEPDVGRVPAQGSITVHVPATRTFTLTAFNASGTDQAGAIIRVAPPPPLASGTIFAVPDTLPEGGGSTTLIWVSEDAVSASLDHGIGDVPLNGTLLRAVTTTSDFRLRLTNASGSTDRVVRVVVRNSTPVLPSGGLTITPDSLGEGGGEITLRWSSSGADSAILSPGVGSVPTNGSRSIVVGATQAFVLTLVNAAGWFRDSAWIVVAAPAAGPLDITGAAFPVTLTRQPGGVGNPDIEIVRDGLMPPVGATNTQEQFATYDGVPKEFDWIGYEFSEPRSFRGLLFQEGMHFHDGGWFEEVGIQVRVGNTWVSLDSAVFSPPYTGGNGTHYESFDVVFPRVAGTGIRLAGRPGGAARYVSVGELRAFETSIPRSAPLVSLALSRSVVPPEGGEVEVHWCITGAEGGVLDGAGAVGPTGRRVLYVSAPGGVAMSASNENGTTTAIAIVEAEQPRDYWIEQNYPNPFNPSTRIRFTVHAETPVTLVVFDLLGRTIRNLYGATMQPGSRVVEWDGRDDRGVLQPTGVYFYRFTAAGFVETKRMVMVK